MLSHKTHGEIQRGTKIFYLSSFIIFNFVICLHLFRTSQETIEDIKQLQATNNTKEYIVETKIMKNRIRGGGVQHKFFVLSLSETTSKINSQPTANIS